MILQVGGISTFLSIFQGIDGGIGVWKILDSKRFNNETCGPSFSLNKQKSRIN